MGEKTKPIYEQIRNAKHLLRLTDTEVERDPYNVGLYEQSANLRAEIEGLLERSLRA
jgi:hypothetical protein